MKNILVLVNVLIIGFASFLAWDHYHQLKVIDKDYQLEDEALNTLVAKFQDSTSSQPYKYSWTEITAYAAKLQNDSLANFVIREATRSEYFVSYESQLRENLNVITYSLQKRDRDYTILLIICIASFLINVLFITRISKKLSAK